jgi:Gdp/GTP exchange factor required for growth at low temperatures
VRKLVKAVKECKDAHTGVARHGHRDSTISRPKKAYADANEVVGELRDEGKIWEALKPQKGSRDDDSDVDLDFTPEEGLALGFSQPTSIADPSPAQSAEGGITPAPGSVITSMSVLQQPVQKAILQHNLTAGSGKDADATPFVQTAATLPIHHNPIQRAFVNTVGRLGRWKRVLHSRSTIHTPIGVCANVSAFDLELSETGDLLHMRGGLERYLKMIDQQNPVRAPHLLSSSEPVPMITRQIEIPDDDPSSPQKKHASIASTATAGASNATDSTVLEPLQEDAETEDDVDGPLGPPGLSDHRTSMAPSVAESVGSVLSSLGEPIPTSLGAGDALDRGQTLPPWRMDIVSIDELELSDLSDESMDEGPANHAQYPNHGLRRAARKLPLRRDFQFVKPESVSSMGIRSHDSMSSSITSGSESSVSGMPGGALLGDLQQWQVNAIVDSLSDDEEGNAEDALRKLEGQISRDVRQAKASKLNTWVRQIRERMAAGDYEDEPSRFPTSDEESDDDYGEERPRNDASSSQMGSPIEDRGSVYSSASRRSSVQLSANGGSAADATTPLADQTTHNISMSSSPMSSDKARPAIEDVVPRAILESRIPASTAAVPASTASSPPTIPQQVSRFAANSQMPRAHRSWILSHRADVLAVHFGTIDRELFLAVNFEELISAKATDAPEEVHVLDWAQFLKDRARYKAEGRRGPKTSALVALRARFNLMAAFVTSEVVLTPPHERYMVIGKFIRVAFVSALAS